MMQMRIELRIYEGFIYKNKSINSHRRLRGFRRLKTKSFDELLLRSIDEALASLGESARQAIYFHLESKFKIAKQNIPTHLEEFAEGLEKIFGVGAKYIEILIMKQMYKTVGQPLDWNEDKELVFVDYVNAAEKSFSNRQK